MFPDAITNPSFSPKDWIDEQERLSLKAFRNWKKEVLKDNKVNPKTSKRDFDTKELTK